MTSVSSKLTSCVGPLHSSQLSHFHGQWAKGRPFSHWEGAPSWQPKLSLAGRTRREPHFYTYQGACLLPRRSWMIQGLLWERG